MVRFSGLGALGLRRFRPSVHLYPPLVLISCLVASTAAPAESTLGHDALAQLRELRELLVPGFGREPEMSIGVGGIGLSNPVSGLVVPPFRLGSDSSIDGFVVPSGVFLARSGDVAGRGGFRLTNPLAFRWTGTATTLPLRLTWQAGTLFDNVFDGSTGAFVPFRIVPAGPPSVEPVLALVAEPADGTDGLGERDEMFEKALLPPAPSGPAGEQPRSAPGELPGDGGEGPSSQPVGDGEVSETTPVPGPLPVAGVALAWRCSRRLRQRLRQGR
ncbi:hypothetical protein VB738_07480 [Cyanobium gracile UHCC 0139]|uniref:PEP-CTERM sorting domain-containing protein n=1 Tax=Cyanobium gracile UHCC 0139 TaxID=3110308 RepID=A0ABU5RTI8_9CYAN|nr:hypothetical protein [Cyanobium gracile]MEA5391102.1 hypothetical protein [Cyanobium gracile UHCC 0139]